MGFFADIFVVYFARVLWRLVELLRSCQWGRVAATISGVRTGQRSYYGVSIDYLHTVNDSKYFSTFVKPFMLGSSEKAFASRFSPGMSFMVRIRPGHPEVSVADPSEWNW
jgi:hypothetical protein